MRLKICPRCGSLNVDWIIPQNWSVWVCKDCSYTGPIIEGDIELALEIKEDYKKQKDLPINDDLEEDLTDEEIEKKLDELYE